MRQGANDNASGVAGVIESARVLSQYTFNGSIVYAALSGEEQGLFGGKILAKYAQDNNWRVHGVLNNDMIGNSTGINGVTDNTTARIFSEGTRVIETKEQAHKRRFTGGEVDSASRNLARYIDTIADKYIENLDTMLVYRLDRFGRGGHHRPFNDVGFAAVRIMETNENYNQQHQDLRTEDGITYGDTIDHVDFAYAAKLTSLNAVSQWLQWHGLQRHQRELVFQVQLNQAQPYRGTTVMILQLQAIKFTGVIPVNLNGNLAAMLAK